MSATSRITINTVLNPGVQFAGGNMILFAPMGWLGMIATGGATALALVLALRAELGKTCSNDNDPAQLALPLELEKPRSLLDDPRTAMLASAAAQAVIAGIAIADTVETGGTVMQAVKTTAAVPLLSGFSNVVTAGMLEKLSGGIKTLFNVSAAKEKSAIEKIITGPDLYFVPGGALGSGPALPYTGPLFLAGAAISLHNKIRKRPDQGVLNPYVWFAGTCLVGVGMNLSAPFVLVAFTMFAMGFGSVHAINQKKGVYEFLKNRSKPKV